MLRYYYTLKELLPIQIFYRLKYIIKRKYYEKKGRRIFASYKRKFVLKNPTHNLNDKFILNNRKHYKGSIEEILSNKFTFLNSSINFGSAIDWHAAELNQGTRLWKLNLNYHEFLIDVANKYVQTKDSRYLKYLMNTINEWLVQNPIGTKNYGKDNWNSYAISLRVIAWIKIFNLVEKDFPNDFKDVLLKYLWIQSEFLKDNLELDILGNHLIKNWKALVWLGIFFEQTDFLRVAHDIYNKYIITQFSNAGMHEELSPMYAGIVLEDLMEVYLFTGEPSLRDLIHKLFEKINLLCFDGQYSFFNDSINNNGVDIEMLRKFYSQIFPNDHKEYTGGYHFDGYTVLKNKNECLIFDSGPLVLGRQPGHGHCDALSFEYFKDGCKFFTNSGVFEYNDTPRRIYSRSTESHNTLKFESFDQSQTWSSFRVAKRAKITCELHQLDSKVMDVSGHVEGFVFDKKVIHHRRILKRKNKILIYDKLTSNVRGRSTIYFHVSPSFKFEIHDSQIYVIEKITNERACHLKTNAANLQIDETDFYPEFGKTIKKNTLMLKDINVGDEIKTEIIIK